MEVWLYLVSRPMQVLVHTTHTLNNYLQILSIELSCGLVMATVIALILF